MPEEAAVGLFVSGSSLVSRLSLTMRAGIFPHSHGPMRVRALTQT